VAPLLGSTAGSLLCLNRPEKRNALSIELRELLMLELGALAADGEVRCAVLTGAGTAFCSGMDRNEFGGDRAHRGRPVAASLGAFAAVGTFAKPLIAAPNGPALAGGFALALLCDLRIAGPEATVGSRRRRDSASRPHTWRRGRRCPPGWRASCA
jgi:enoyl-CoA hydratase/carnithine racemase